MIKIKKLVVAIFCLLLVACKKDIDLAPPQISSFSFVEVPIASVIIDAEQHTITVSVPFDVDITKLTPIIKTNEAVSIIPSSDKAQNFSKPVYYTLSSKDAKNVYLVTVKREDYPSPVIEKVDRTEIDAGGVVNLYGKNFGKNALEHQVFLNGTQRIESKYISEQQIAVTIPEGILGGLYEMDLKVKSLSYKYPVKMKVIRAAPRLMSSSRKNVIQGDTLIIRALYKDRSVVQIMDGTGKKTMATNVKDSLVVIPPLVLPGPYALKLWNEENQKQSNALDLHIYDAAKPFIRHGSLKVLAQNQISFIGINFKKIHYKTLQLQVSSPSKSFALNAISEVNQDALNFELPSSMPKGTYRLVFVLLDDQNTPIYSFEIDQYLVF